MKPIKTYDQFVNEAENPVLMTKTLTTKITVSFDIDWNENIGKVEDTFTLAMSPDSSGIYTIGDDIEKFTGVPEKDIKKDIAAGKEKPDDALIFGMSNTMNGGKDIYLWVNGTRLSGAAEKAGVWPALFEIISHESTHLTRQILTRAISKKKGIKIENGDWINEPWPTVGDDPKVNLIDEEAFATSVGYVVQEITPHFLKMASNYIQELKTVAI
jgi:hypothetical protein